MDRVSSRPRYWLLDQALPFAGFALLVFGLVARPALLPLAWLALGLTLFRWVAEADGVAWPLRVGRRPVQTVGCWEVPLAFTIRHRGETLLFARNEDSAEGGWADSFAVYAAAPGFSAGRELPVGRGWTLRGRAPVAALRFERHERVLYVERRSLERAVAEAKG